MSLIVFWPFRKENKGFASFSDVIMQVVPRRELEFYHSFAALFTRLRLPLFNVQVIILAPENMADLAEIMLLKDMLQDRQVIFILPEEAEEGEMVAKAHTLRPRLLIWRDSGLSSLAGVLQRMLHTGSDGRDHG